MRLALHAGWLGAVVVLASACSGTPEDAPGVGVAHGSAKGTGGSDSGAGSSGGTGNGGTLGSGATGGATTGGTSNGAASGKGGKGGAAGAPAKGGAGGTLGLGGLPGVGGLGLGGLPGVGGLGLGGLGTGGTDSCTCSEKLPTIGGCPVFTADDAWNQDVSGATVDAAWTTRLLTMVGSVKLHPDYGGDASALYGIPIGVVPADQPLLPVVFDWWADESDAGPYPFPSPGSAMIEGGDAMNCDGDCHLLVVQQGTCQLYEGYACHYENGWHCGNGAHWDLTKNSYGQRPKGWTSADAAGLAITPGIVRYDEVRAGEIRHAIRFTTSCSRPNFVAPATHDAVPSDCDENDPNSPPMGLRVRLKSDYPITSLPASAQVVLTAMKRYGMILADNGSNFYFQGEANLGWTDDDIAPLKDVPASAFEVVGVPALEQ